MVEPVELLEYAFHSRRRNSRGSVSTSGIVPGTLQVSRSRRPRSRLTHFVIRSVCHLVSEPEVKFVLLVRFLPGGLAKVAQRGCAPCVPRGTCDRRRFCAGSCADGPDAIDRLLDSDTVLLHKSGAVRFIARRRKRGSHRDLSRRQDGLQAGRRLASHRTFPI